jgi:hypothetical protein
MADTLHMDYFNYDLSNAITVSAVSGFHRGQLNNLNFTNFSTKQLFGLLPKQKGGANEN